MSNASIFHSIREFPNRDFNFFSTLAQIASSLLHSSIGEIAAEMLQSLVKSCYFSSVPLRVFASRGDQCFYVQNHYRFSDHSGEMSSPKTHSRDLHGRDESKRVAASDRE